MEQENVLSVEDIERNIAPVGSDCCVGPTDPWGEFQYWFNV
jgi:hypothetical protein